MTYDTDIHVRCANNIRILSAAMVEQAKSGHPGGAMGGADFIQVLFSEFLVSDPDDPEWFFRDRFFLDPGHMSAMLYSVLSFTGNFSMDDLRHFRSWKSVTPGHPERDVSRRIENTSGPLGQGHTNAVGAAITERFLAERFGEWTSHKTYTFISDGGIQEEISQGAGRIAGFLGLKNLIMFFDSNDLQLSSATSDVTHEDTARKYEAWGWNTLTIDGHNIEQIRQALKQATEESDRPTLIIGKTIMGKGAVDSKGNSIENQYETHGQPLSKAGGSFDRTVQNLGGDPANPFQIFPEVRSYYEQVTLGLRREVARRRQMRMEWETANPEKAGKLNAFIAGELPDLNLSGIQHKPDSATRNASGNVLSYLAGRVENMIVASADLSNSDKTDSFLAKTTSFRKHDFSGSFLQAGVSELTMAAIANGMALHGGVIPACATFFVFSDFMKPAVRLAALMELPVIYIWTHDSFRVGEDGPTHQPVEQEAQIRLLEKLKNHSGRNSFLALRPADADETTIAWKMALENRSSPTGLILSRQNITSLPAKAGSDRATDAIGAEKGAYIVKDAENPDVILIASGSEVSTLVGGANRLENEKNLAVRVVSVMSEGLFYSQAPEYIGEILPNDVPRFGLSAGLPVTLQSLVGDNGRVIGLESFGYSAPAEVLDEKLGYTADNVFEQVNLFLKDYHTIKV